MHSQYPDPTLVGLLEHTTMCPYACSLQSHEKDTLSEGKLLTLRVNEAARGVTPPSPVRHR